MSQVEDSSTKISSILPAELPEDLPSGLFSITNEKSANASTGDEPDDDDLFEVSVNLLPLATMATMATMPTGYHYHFDL